MPDLVLRSFEPPGVEVRGQDLTALLTPAYLRLAGHEELAGEGQEVPVPEPPSERAGERGTE